jgi:hypothetical protein
LNGGVTRGEACVYGGFVSFDDMALGLCEALSYWFWIFRLGVLPYLAAGIQSVNCTEAFSFRHESRRFYVELSRLHYWIIRVEHCRWFVTEE